MIDGIDRGTGIYRIYVSGFGHNRNPSLLLDYFSQYGPVSIDWSSIQSSGAGSQQEKKSIGKGIDQDFPCQKKKSKNYLVLYCQDRRTYEAILRQQYHWCDGTQIVCFEFKSGIQLIMHNQKLNQRRVILRRVPTTVTSEEVIEFMHEIAGNVESIYVYPTLSKGKAHQHYSTSVTFEHKRGLKALINFDQAYGIFLGGEKIFVEKYCSKKGPNMTKSILQEKFISTSGHKKNSSITLATNRRSQCYLLLSTSVSENHEIPNIRFNKVHLPSTYTL